MLLMKRILLLVTLVICSSWAFSQSQITKGERPPIDLERVPAEAYEQGKIQIKLMPNMDKSIPDVTINASKSEYVVTGVNTLDELNKEFGAKQYKPLLDGMYEKSAKSTQYRERHKAWGFHLWFEVEVDSKADVKEIIKKYSALAEVEIAEPVFKK
ncbi:MAG: hypothetical protein CVT98_08985, partial [Bacteroidetes bacterium HGW-Bacteroidetes-15]